MIRFFLFLLLVATSSFLPGQTTKTIGTGTSSQPQPYSIYYGFERSAAIYLKSEIASFGYITSLGWQVQFTPQEICPIKIYLKLTTSPNLSATTWDQLKDGATLVYNASASFPSTGWNTINISDFTYWSSTSGTNLLVLTETNYGENGNSQSSWFYYSLVADNKHEYWQSNGSAPAGNGTPNKNRPNIQITYLPVNAHNPPSGFMATAVSSSQVNLSWSKNSANDNVMIAYNTANTFGNPSGTYIPGDNISGGGTVIYNGSGTSMNQTTGLNPGTTYYYMAWSVYSSTPSYSSGTGSSATTFCETTSVFPYIVDFEPVNFPPSCWTLSGKPWSRFEGASGYGIGSASAKADFFNISPGNFNLISPVLNLASLTLPEVKFDHAYATGLNDENDKLELWYSTDNGATYILLYTWPGGNNGPLNTGGASGIEFVPLSNQWATKSQPLPSGANRIMLRGVTAYGNNLYLDNVSIIDIASIVTWSGNISTSWNNPLNWVPNVIPNQDQEVVIPQGSLYYPVINATGFVCKQITISNNATLTVNANSEIIVYGDVTIQNGGSLINNGLVTVTGSIDIQD